MFLLAAFARSAQWWEFNNNEFNKYESASVDTPIFAICIASYCPHCRGLPELLQNYSATLGNTTNLVLTNIDYQRSDVCSRAKIRGVPTFLLIRGTSAKYWVQDYGRSPNDWSNFLQNQIGPIHREIHSDDEKRDSIRRSVNGGTAFHLTLPQGQTDLLKSYQRLSARDRIYGISMTYEISEKIDKPTIEAFLSPDCATSATIDKAGLEKFIVDNRFSDFHHYDLSEYHSMRNKQPFSLCIVHNDLRESQSRAFQKFSSENCHRMRFGWASAKSDQNLFKTTRVSEDDAPFLYVTRPGQPECSVVSKRRMSDFGNSQIFERMINGGDCSNKTTFPRIEKPTKSHAIGGYVRVASLISLVAAPVLFVWPFVFSSDPKLE
jgi:thiol-disulfide isomerase/thioredoxin